MSLELVLSGKGNIAFHLASLIWTLVMSGLEMFLKRLIVRVIDILEVLSAEMTRQMQPAQMVKEHLVIVKVLFTEVAPGMRQNLRSSFISWISMFKMVPQILFVVDSLLSDEHGATFKTNFAESFLVI